MPRPPSIQWYYKQWLGDNKVQGMEWDAYGMHFHLLNLSVQEEPPGSLPNDMVLIRRWLRNPSDDVWRRVQPQVFSAWSLRGDRWFNSGLVAICERRDNYLKRYENGTKLERESEETLRTLKTVVVVDSSKNQDSDLELIYKAYPRKVGKGDAFKAIRKAFQRLLSGEDEVPGLLRSYEDVLAYLIGRVTKFAQSAAGQAGEYTPHPATWFNQKRYLDDEREWQRMSSSDTKQPYSDGVHAIPQPERGEPDPKCQKCKGTGGMQRKGFPPGNEVWCDCVYKRTGVGV